MFVFHKSPQVPSGFIKKIYCMNILKESLSLVKEGDLCPSYHLMVGLLFFSVLLLVLDLVFFLNDSLFTSLLSTFALLLNICCHRYVISYPYHTGII